jgi:hypothetical protein
MSRKSKHATVSKLPSKSMTTMAKHQIQQRNDDKASANLEAHINTMKAKHPSE